ncbi:MAG: TIM barrel protein [Caulobacteraceae bacterium]|nr:TIM barrel protein [Caulobacteraceae bacterium]
MPKLAANLSTLFTETPLLERFARAAACGFRWVELQFPYEVPPDALARALRAAGLELVLMNAPAGDAAAGEWGLALEGGPRFEASIRRALEYTDQTACPRLHVLTGMADVAADAEAWARLTANLRWAADALAPHGVSLMLEALNRIDRPGYALPNLALAERLRRAVARPNVALQFDAYHAARDGLDPVGLLGEHLPATGHVQIADAADRGEPDSDAAHAFLAALDRRDYQGFVGCEYLPRGDTAAGLGWAARYGLGPR